MDDEVTRLLKYISKENTILGVGSGRAPIKNTRRKDEL